MSGFTACYEAPLADGMTCRIMRGYSIQQVKSKTVIFDHLGYRWHTFDGIVPMEAAKVAIEAFKAGVEAGRVQADADAGHVLATLKDVASRAGAAVSRHAR